ncbi:Suppressor of glycerol defect protein 1 [Cyberlindnera fabianii]|uniref:Suppressor of glycerol defect protein 1 n=1 Tax=Cyberlindnera fabianii TaxID=36022 RepID=A0A1V2LC43_CYBFA|nr:Suppressor of glycerol defect protein 1 [Cyberlindnera fabianii]
MGSRKHDRDEPHAIRLPGSILDEIKAQKEDDDGTRFEFGQENYEKKRKAPVSRKEQRKQERANKKQKKAQQPKKSRAENESKRDVKKSGKSIRSSLKSEPKTKQKKSVTFSETNQVKEFTGFSSDDSISEGDFDSDISDAEDLDAEDFGSDDFDEADAFSDDENQPQTAEDTMAALMALKAKKNGKAAPSPVEKTKGKKDPSTAAETMAALKAAKDKKKSKVAPEPKVEDEESDDSDGFSDEDEDMDGFSDDEFTDDEGDQPQTAEDVFAALKAAKEKKKNAGTSAADTMTALKAKKEEKAKKERKEKEKMEKEKKEKERKKKEKEETKFKRRPLTDEEEALRKRDERDMKHYAKLLGMKSTSIKDFKKHQVDDGLGDLLDGLDFLDEYGGEEPSDEEPAQDDVIEYNISEPESDDTEEESGDGQDDDDEEIVENPFSSDDEINSSDFDSDLDGELDDEDEEDGDTIVAGPKENPYIAPVASNAPKGKYIPPAMRARLAGNADSEAMLKVKRLIKGPLNKLSEANVLTIVNEVNSVYLDNPRQVVTECLANVVLESIVQQSVLLDTFVTLHAALLAAIYRLQGVEVGAYFIQNLVEKYEEHYKANQGKEAGNLLSLLTALYSFQVVSCKLLYNLISTLITSTTELNSELLLRIVRNAGQQMRSDDPNALKEIIMQFQENVQGQEVNTRTRFLIETITNLRNNKSKNMNEQTQQLVIRMKKVLATVNNRMNEPLQVSLDDIHNIDTKGKWWLVGSAWKGNQASEASGVNDVEMNTEEMNDILDSAEPNWMELARSQRMNTDIRRAIFITIMSSQDYIEAFTKLDKLRLKRSQEREIPKILLHCVSIEKVYNPYYGLLANKLCSQHSLRKTMQFCFWDLLKELEGDDSDDSEDEGDYFKKLNTDIAGNDDDFQLQRTVNLGKFFGNLIAEGSLPLHSLKSLNFLSLSEDVSMFLEVMLIAFYDGVGKKSEISAFGAGTKKSKKAEDLIFEEKLLVERLLKCKEQNVLLRGLQYFVQSKVRGSELISGRKQKKRVEWGVDATCDIAGELLKQLE